MEDTEFCVVCGRTGRPLADGVCAECAAAKTRLVWPVSRPTVVVCPQCGSRRVGSRWEREGASSVLTAEDLNPQLEVGPEVALRRVDWEEIDGKSMRREYVAHARVRFRGAELRADLPVSVFLEHRSCPDCSRRSGHYYTALIQLRGTEEGPRERAPALRARLDDAWEKLMGEARADWRHAISWKEALPEGWDFYLTDTLAARALARLAKSRLHSEVKESPTLAGRKHGVEVYRVTFCVRVPKTEPTTA